MSKTRQAASFDLIHQVRFHFRHVAVLHAIEQEVQQSFRDRHIIPNKYWHLEESGEHGECWVVFQSDDPFFPEELEQCRANIELMDAACEAMVRGTNAEVR
jgi:hypothetical protein